MSIIASGQEEAIRMSKHNILFFNMTKKITLSHPKSAAINFCSKGFKNEFESDVVNEQSLSEPLYMFRFCFSAKKKQCHLHLVHQNKLQPMNGRQ